MALDVLGHHRHRRHRLIGIAALVPTTPASTTGGGLRGELGGAFRNKQVWLSIAITILGYGGMFGAFTYIAFTLTEVTGFATSSVPWLLILFGSGLFVGNFLGAKRPTVRSRRRWSGFSRS